MEVYAIEVGQGQRLSEGEVRNRFYDSFGVQLQGAIGVVSDPEAEADEGGYPCGTLLCVTGGNHLHTSSIESHLCTSPVVATSNFCYSAESLVAGNQDVTVPQASDSQSPSSFREGFTHLSHPPQETAMSWRSAIKPARKSNGTTTSTDSDHPPVSDVVSNSDDMAFNTVSKLHEVTPSTQGIPVIVLNEGGSKRVVAIEEESPKSANSQEETSSKHRKSAVVIGMHRRTCSDIGIYERSDEMQNNIRVRTLSDSNIVELKSKCSGLLHRDGIQETGSALAKRSSKPTPSLTNSSPCEPTQPIQRQCSGVNETVMEGARPTFDVQSKQHRKQTKFKVTEAAIEEEREEEREEEDGKIDTDGDGLNVTFVVGEESDGSFCSDDESHSPQTEKELFEDYNSWTSNSDVNVEVRRQVHVLEHACNGRCFQGSVCTSDQDCHFVESVQEMQAMVKSLVDGNTSHKSAKVKEYIRAHCTHCDVAGCKVPHMAAGCPPAKPAPPLVKTLPVGSISYDLEPAFISTSPYGSQPDHDSIPKTTGLNDQPSVSPPSQPPSPHTPHSLHVHNDNFIDDQERLKYRVYRDHQVVYHGTDRCQTANGREVYSYLQPDVAENARLRQAFDPNLCLPDVGMLGFPKNLYASYRVWYSPGESSATLIYSSQELQRIEPDFVPGLSIPRPTMKERDQLGSGGNGQVFKFPIRGQELAVKSTCYRPAELNVWQKMDCPNVIPLYGVVLDGHDYCKCFQLMPKMTTDLREVLRRLHQRCGNLGRLIKDDPKTWKELVEPNVCYILHEVLQGLSYLRQNNIQHGDLKAKNILIKKKKKCTCPDVLHCCCPMQDKCEVRIADFDAVRKTVYPSVASSFPVVATTAKTPKEMGAKLGTMGYRAPEQFQRIIHTTANHNLVLAHKKEVEGSTTEIYDLEGPWCDVWSLGVIILLFCLGSISEDDKMESWCLHHQPHKRELTPVVEDTCAILRLNKLLAVCLDHHELEAFGHLAKKCLVVEFRRRPTPEELLNDDLFTV